MHKLLLRQLKRHTSLYDSPASLPQEWEPLLDAVATAYEQFDEDRSLLERSMELASQELLERNQRLREDIMERQRAQEALRESEAKYHAVVAQTAEGIYLADIHTRRFLETNTAYQNMLGYTAEEFLQLTVYDVVAHDPESIRENLERALSSGHHFIGERQQRRKDGSLVDVEVSLNVVTLNTGTICAAIVRDITERKRAEEALQQANKDLELRVAERTLELQTANSQLQRELNERTLAEKALEHAKAEADNANHTKSEFLSRMSHELRTPLNSILGFSQLLKMDSTTPEQHESVDYIVKGGKHLLELINEILDIARIETGKISLSPEPISLAEILQECLDLVRPMAAQRELHLQTGTLLRNDRHVMADRQRFKQVLLNLLANAIKYNRAGGSVSVECEPLFENRMRIRISDTGPGIPSEKMSKLFIPFERLGAEQSTVEGTGLGLALSKNLMEAMGGSIGVDSTVGKGSTFWVDLPQVEGQIQRFERIGTGPLSLDRMSVRSRTILYIEDNLSNLRLVERILAQRPDLKLISAMQGGLGVELAHQHHPDLILLDLHLPDITGDEVLRRLRENPNTGTIPVVILSADATPPQIERLLASGAKAYLTKPLDLLQFAQVLEETLIERVGK